MAAGGCYSDGSVREENKDNRIGDTYNAMMGVGNEVGKVPFY